MTYAKSRLAMLAILVLTASSTLAHARCQVEQLEAFLANRAFELSADEKIQLYADRLVRYFDKRDISRQQVLRSIRNWEQRWPERIYKYMRIRDYKQTEEADACKVTFDYRFLAYSPRRDKISAGIGRATLVLAEVDDGDQLRIIGEFGRVLCRGLTKFARSRC